MLTNFDKALAGLITSAVAFLSAVGVNVPEWTTPEWAGAVAAALNPIAVYLIANKAKSPGSGPTTFRASGFATVAALGLVLLAVSACAGKNVSLVTTRDPGQVTYVTLAIDKLAGPACPDAPADVANMVRGERATALLAVARDFYGAKYPGAIGELEKAVLKFQDAIARGVSKDTLEAWAGPAQLQVINLLAEIIEEEHSYFFGAPSPLSAVRELRNKAIPLATRLSEVKATVLEGCESRGYPVAPEFFADVDAPPKLI